MTREELFLMLLSGISLMVGYRWGRGKKYSPTVFSHALKEQLRPLIFSRQNWTAREIYDQIKYTIQNMKNTGNSSS